MPAHEGVLAGTVAIVTGGGRGIGRAIALLMGLEGARVVVADNGSNADGDGRADAVARGVANEIEDQGGVAMPSSADVSDSGETAALVGKTIARFGRLDAVVNAAGNLRPGTILDTDLVDFRSIIDVHLLGTFNVCQAATRHWLDMSSPGRLINVASRAGLLGHPEMLAYSATKAGVIGLTLSCANALAAHQITANVIVPLASTRLVEQPLGSTPAQGAEVPRLPSPEHVAPMAVFLASSLAATVTGRVFGAWRGHYTRWSVPVEERSSKLVWPDQYPAMLEDFAAQLGEDVSPDDLWWPLSELRPRDEGPAGGQLAHG